MYFSSTCLLLVGLLSLQGAAAAPGPAELLSGHTIPLARRSRQQFTHEEWESWAAQEVAFLHSRYRGSSQPQKRAQGTNLLGNQGGDSAYWGTLAIGSPAVAFDVILDTGSSDLWVVGNCGSGCPQVAAFDGSTSSTFQNLSQPFSIEYGSGSASGSLVADVVQMAGFSVQNQPFGLVDQVSGGLLSSPISGLLGLAWQSIASSGKMPFWQTLVSSGDWSQPVMSFQLTRYINASNVQSNEPGGSFTMGFVNTSLYTGDIDYQSIGSPPSFWLLPLTSLTVQGNSVSIPSGSSPNAAIDTGTTLIGGPASAIQNIFAQIPGSQPGTGNWAGYYTYPCSTKVNVTLSFGGRSWPISSADFQLTKVSSSQCVGAFFELSSGSGPTWVVGDTFLKNVYSVFSYNPTAVGFAQLSETALAANGVSGKAPSATIGSISASATAGGSSAATGKWRVHPGVVLASVVGLVIAAML